MRYALFVTDDCGGSKQLYDSYDLQEMKRDADQKQRWALENDLEGLEYIVKQAYRTVYKGRKRIKQ